jgi:hypothetical protein
MARSGGTDVCQLEYPSIFSRLCNVSLKTSINYFLIVSVVLQSRSVTTEHLGFTWRLISTNKRFQTILRVNRDQAQTDNWENYNLYHLSDIKPKRMRWAGYIACMMEIHKHSLLYSKSGNFEKRIIPNWPQKSQTTRTGLKWLKISSHGGIFWWHGGNRIP